MDFSKRKLPQEVFKKLYRVTAASVMPFTLMAAPVYILLAANEKFVAVKAPLDFFTPEELTHLSRYEFFYFSDFVFSAMPYLEAASTVRQSLSYTAPSTSKISLPPSSFEVSDQVLKAIGPLWWEYSVMGAGIEPFLVALFVNELCTPLSSDILVESREKSVESFEKALFHSSWVVFLALVLGYCNLAFLNNLRNEVFKAGIQGIRLQDPRREIDDLIALAAESLEGLKLERAIRGIISENFFITSPESVAQKIAARLERVKREFLSRGSEPPCIYGDRGFIDV